MLKCNKIFIKNSVKYKLTKYELKNSYNLSRVVCKGSRTLKCCLLLKKSW